MRRSPMMKRGAVALLILLPAAVSLSALGGRVAQLRAVSSQVRAAIELRDAFPSTLKEMLERGGTLHVRIEAGLWEDRAMWDRAVEPPRVSTFRIVRQPNGAAIAVIDSGGGVTMYKPYPDPLTIDVDLAAVDKLARDAKYYLDAAVTIGTITEDDVDEANEAVFGRDNGPAGLKRVGKFLLNTVLQVSDYVRSVSTTVRSGRFRAADLRGTG